MFLKKVVISGFKSFADRTEFEFGPGVTGIVGPNGCGKSNVVDAVRWVLGEQSARSLRGTRMLDVIFAGARSRPPANAAEVELTFDNTTRFLSCDEATVSISRTLFRSGESEYRVNGSLSRLKDIRSLFLDTGVGVSAYSIIEQGRVDVLLQANPVERREIFEEAAGISRYRAQRAEAARKLERTEANLLRLQDVLEELERQLRSVKLAAGKARNFQEYDERLRALRSSFSLAEYHQHTEAWRAADADVAALLELVQQRRAALTEQDAQAAAIEQQLRANEAALHAAELRLGELQSESSTLAERQVQGQRRLTELTEMRRRRESQAAEGVARLAELEQRLTAEEAALATLADEVERGARQAGALERERDAAARRCDESRGRLERERSAAFAAIRKAMLLHNQQGQLEQQQQRLGTQIEALRNRGAALREQLAGVEQRRAELAGATAALEQRAAELAEQVRAAETRVAELQSARQTLDGQIAETKEARAATMSRLGVLEDMERRREGVDRGTLDVLAWRDGDGADGGVVGLVADVLRIDDPRVDVLQPVLAAVERHVVVRAADAFMAALAARGAPPGAVRVVALDRLAPPVAHDAFATAPGVVGRAAEWVQCDPSYRPLAEALLGHVWAVADAAAALALAAGAPRDAVFVAPDGVVAGGDGLLTVGTGGATAGLISRKAEIRQLQVQLDEVETRLEQLQRARQARDAELSDAQVQRGALLNDVAAVQKQHAEQRTALMRADDEATRTSRELTAAEGELASLRGSLAECLREAEQVRAERSAADEVQRTHEAQVTAFEQELAALDAALQQYAGRLTEALVEVGRSRERHQAATAALRQTRARRDALHAEQAAAEREAGEAAAAIDAARAELAATETRAAGLAAALERERAAAAEQRTALQTLRGALEACSSAGRALQAEIEAAEGRRHAAEVARREVEVRRENLVARVRDELGQELDALYADYAHTEQDWAAIRGEIEELRGKIARLGHVNLDALRELEELTPRHEHLVTQRQDLIAGSARLRELIDELDRESRTRFLASFEQVRRHFQELFRKLFGGGKADIVLEDPDNPLECGIEIIARPPGKEPQSISLLSGGEKTMSAVALLLAVFQSRPSPFAILDEVDAALDESNVGRFNSVVQEFLAHSQVVIITHNKRTMQQADVLYGVTMEESGVSKRVGVRFDERVDTPAVA